ncbi:hypothetical protein Aab01nite_05060 [Paractinoplanes abujensis]|uniref:Uncharacterized protein n=1 Tax=Paractinoplanes abujensis TaxID=882441 RepID=A0A7W7CN75_9ACTN|nr:hypothetical protein [Actinoplanes abujensis]MBB4691663.1 hypothetical protein [Actinoplanes abujensis]GID16916.1 hypothetical protein Aab01nite_05060 [Actinoplanes abujensis]
MSDNGEVPLRRLWAQDAMAEVRLFQARLDIAATRVGLLQPQPAAERQVTVTAVHRLLECARKAAHGRDPVYRPVYSWWSGNCVEAAFRNLHNAEGLLALLYNQDEARAETPEAVRRANESLPRGTPVHDLACELAEARKEGAAINLGDLSKVIEAGHAAADRQRARLRTFRNVLTTGMTVTAVLVVVIVVVAAFWPDLVPLCFVQDAVPANEPNVACPVRATRVDDLALLHTAAGSWDFAVVAALGLLGGALSSALFIRDLYANATPYNVTVPLALLKLPAGALTALAGIILLAGEFVPGFSAIDKPIQILAYALVFGFAQQLFTHYLDQRAQRLVNAVPTKARGASADDSVAVR